MRHWKHKGDKYMSGTFYNEYEVFSKRAPDKEFIHQFSLTAPNDEIAKVMAQENFLRREPVSDLWVVRREHILTLSEGEKHSLQRLDNKDYRNTKGYGYLRKKWRQYEQNPLDEKEIMGWAKE